MPTKASVLNAALLALGQPALVVDPDVAQDYDAAIAVVEAWDLGAAEAVLKARLWTSTETLASLSADPVAPTWGYARRFAVPADCLRIWDFDPERHGATPDYRLRGGFVETNEAAPLNLRYARNAPVEEWDNDLAEAVALEIAQRCALRVLGSHEARDNLREEAKSRFSMAAASDSQQNLPSPVYSGWMSGRSTG